MSTLGRQKYLIDGIEIYFSPDALIEEIVEQPPLTKRSFWKLMVSLFDEVLEHS